MSSSVAFKEMRSLKTFFVFEALPSQMPSDGYGAAVSTSNGLNLGQGSSSVLTDSQLDPPAQCWGKSANGDYRKDHRDQSRSPVERSMPSMGIHSTHLYTSIPSLAMDQPLALTKNVEVSRSAGLTASVSPIERQQNRPSVITCASASNRNCGLSHCPVAHNGCVPPASSSYRRGSVTNNTCDPVIEEHFRRSLGKNYKEPEPVTNSVSITGSVDDHFAKALGETWLQIKAAKDGVPSSPESATRRGQTPPSSHMVNHSQSPSVMS
ncbi:VGLL4 protein, partial [Polypterus senegalus]